MPPHTPRWSSPCSRARTGASRTRASARTAAATCTRARTCSRRPGPRWSRCATAGSSRPATTAGAATTSRSGAGMRGSTFVYLHMLRPARLQPGRPRASGPARRRGRLHRVVLGRPSSRRGASRPRDHRQAARPASAPQAPRRPARRAGVACAPWTRWSCATASSWRRRCGRRRRPRRSLGCRPATRPSSCPPSSSRLIDMLCAQATAETARDVADKTWDLVHDRTDDDPVKRRVVECHEALARLSARGGGSRLLGFAQGEGSPGAIRRSRQGALDRLPVRDGSDARPAHARRSRTARRCATSR